CFGAGAAVCAWALRARTVGARNRVARSTKSASGERGFMARSPDDFSEWAQAARGAVTTLCHCASRKGSREGLYANASGSYSQQAAHSSGLRSVRRMPGAICILSTGKTMTRSLYVASGLLLVLLLARCDSAVTPPPPGEEEEQESPRELTPAGEVTLTVNGFQIPVD